jgi:hypothetical protein
MSVALAAMHNTTDKKLRDSAIRIFGHRAQGGTGFTLWVHIDILRNMWRTKLFWDASKWILKAQTLGPRSRLFLIYPNLTSDSSAVEEPSLHQFLQDCWHQCRGGRKDERGIVKKKFPRNDRNKTEIRNVFLIDAEWELLENADLTCLNILENGPWIFKEARATVVCRFSSLAKQANTAGSCMSAAAYCGRTNSQ